MQLSWENFYLSHGQFALLSFLSSSLSSEYLAGLQNKHNFLTRSLYMEHCMYKLYTEIVLCSVGITLSEGFSLHFST